MQFQVLSGAQNLQATWMTTSLIFGQMMNRLMSLISTLSNSVQRIGQAISEYNLVGYGRCLLFA
jgi:hypothetical protein